MSFLLDTNILSNHFRRPSGLAHRFFQYSGTFRESRVCEWTIGWPRNHVGSQRVASIDSRLR